MMALPRSAILGVFLGFLAARLAAASINGFDFDEVMMICMGFAGFAYVVADLKRERKLDEYAMAHEGRLAALEANADDSVALEGRLRAVEIHVEKEEKIEERLATLGERVAVLEVRPGGHDLGERVAVLETKVEAMGSEGGSDE